MYNGVIIFNASTEKIDQYLSGLCHLPRKDIDRLVKPSLMQEALVT